MRFEQILDADNDYMMDPWETIHGFDSTDGGDASLDTDGDGLDNLSEYRLNIDPRKSDTDADGIPDNWEISYGLNPNTLFDADIDSDGDGLSNLLEYQLNLNPLVADMDADGIPDGWEVFQGLDPIAPEDALFDPDLDGLNNRDEFQADTDPYLMDTDGDQMPDEWEVRYSLNPRVMDGGSDSDGDGWDNVSEFINGTNPLFRDYDNDGLEDAWEISFFSDLSATPHADADNDGLSNIDEYEASTNPHAADTDGDGMSDLWEVNHMLDPTGMDGAADSDGDGWTNLNEFLNQTDPWFRDYDNDSLEDGWEILFFGHLSEGPTGDPDLDRYDNLDEYQNSTNPAVPDNTEDSDNDGMWDRWELLYGLNVGANDSSHQADSDGLSNWEEFQNWTDPRNADSDGDGISDGWEVRHGFDPLIYDAESDSDLDGRSNLEEFQQGTDPNVSDSSGSTADFDTDGMFDGWELENGLIAGVNDSALDSDNDGLTNIQEFVIRTNPLDRDTDSDRLPDLWEHQHGLSPRVGTLLDGKDGDPDVDGLSNLAEYQSGSHPMITDTDNDGMNDGDEVAQGSNPADANDQARRPMDPVEPVTFRIYGDWAAWEMTIQGQGPRDQQTYKLVSPKDGEAAEATHPLKRNNKYRITLNHTGTRPNVPDIWYCIEAKVGGLPAEKTFNDYNSTRIPGVAEIFTVAGGKWVVDNRGGLLSAHHHKHSGNNGGGNVAQSLEAFLLPVEVAPEVLAVNSDFDEGRIDPATGYAIPDCDDTDIALEAVRNHLDGKFAINDRVTDDMHPGFFGVNPSNLGDDFWAGATVTIRKIEKDDPATGHPESGHIRLYGKWGDGASEYRAIVPYNFETLATANLATGGINGTSESVYGAASPFPDGTSYFIEGVHPGKITLEWRYQKGSIDLKHEQEFEVFTKKRASLWRFDLDYKIRLETSNDPSGEIRSITYPDLSDGYEANIERAAEFYDFYRECFHEPLRSHPTGYPHPMSWPGLARLAGSQVIGGLSDSEWGRKALLPGAAVAAPILGVLSPFLQGWTESEIEQLQVALFQGGWQIFTSVGWQHHAFRSSGYEAIEWVATETEDEEAPLMLSAWGDLRQGILDHDKALIDSAASEITDREQNHTIVPTWTTISGLGLGFVDDMFSVLGKNSCSPAGLNFTDLFDVAYLPRSTPPKPLGNLANAANRWTWIDSGTPGGILDTWESESMARKLSLSGDSLKSDAERFSIFSGPSSPVPVLTWDHLDIP